MYISCTNFIVLHNFNCYTNFIMIYKHILLYKDIFSLFTLEKIWKLIILKRHKLFIRFTSEPNGKNCCEKVVELQIRYFFHRLLFYIFQNEENIFLIILQQIHRLFQVASSRHFDVK